MNFKKVMILGCCGSGKSTLARNLATITKLPLFHLDQHYWKENWKETEKKEWQEIVTRLSKNEKWIIDGNYSGTIDIRLSEADTVIYLDYSTLTCLSRVIWRIIKYNGKVRPDMPAGCKERFDFDFLHYVLSFNIRKRSMLIDKLNSLSNSKSIVILKKDSEISDFLKRTERNGSQ